MAIKAFLNSGLMSVSNAFRKRLDGNFDDLDGRVTTLEGATGGGGLTEYIADMTLTAGEFTYTVPSGYTRIILKGRIRSDNASTVDVVYCEMNGDTTLSNYDSQHGGGSSGSTNVASGTNTPRIMHCPGGTANAAAYCKFTTEIDQPDLTSDLLTFMTHYAMHRVSGANIVGECATVKKNAAAALTSIKIRTDNAADNLSGSIRVYGETE